MKNAQLKRSRTMFTLAEYNEKFMLRKIELDPRYQRRGDVWDRKKQSFLIDSILKNFPIPAIFLRQKIDETSGKTSYEVIDGKQRLLAINQFIDNKLQLPSNFYDGFYGDARLNNAKFSDFVDDLSEYKKAFWSYEINIEYIEADDPIVIDRIFDRLNRNSITLNKQELRKAKYYGTDLMNMIVQLTELIDWDKLEKVDYSRMRDQEFTSELLFHMIENRTLSGSGKELDDLYEKWSSRTNNLFIDETVKRFSKIIDIIKRLDLRFKDSGIGGVSNFYTIFAFMHKYDNESFDFSFLKDRLTIFCSLYRKKDYSDPNVSTYANANKDATKSKINRDKRLKAIEDFCNIENRAVK